MTIYSRNKAKTYGASRAKRRKKYSRKLLCLQKAIWKMEVVRPSVEQVAAMAVSKSSSRETKADYLRETKDRRRQKSYLALQIPTWTPMVHAPLAYERCSSKAARSWYIPTKSFCLITSYKMNGIGEMTIRHPYCCPKIRRAWIYM